MPQPTAPMLQAEYHNYNEHSSFNDYYGGFEPKQSTWNKSNGPRRVDGSVSKENRGCCAPAGIYLLSALLIIRCLVTLFGVFLLWSAGYNDETVFWIGVFEAVNLLACLLMIGGVTCSNPYLCVVFTVIRTLEAFCALVFVISFGWAVYDPRSDAGRFMKVNVTDIGRRYQNQLPFKPNWDDVAYQLSMALCLVALFVFSVCIWFMKCAWTATIWAADERRRRKLTDNYEVSRVMVASDELYTNY